ncbi:MAG: InlB B-repeat-containing protein, partial [Planctomycetota bacterium]
MLATRINPLITKVLCTCIAIFASGILWVPVSVGNPIVVEYTVTSSAGPNGAISPDGDTVVPKGSDLDFTATPNTCYKVDKWSVDGAEAQSGGESFTLTDIQADHTVDVTF